LKDIVRSWGFSLDVDENRGFGIFLVKVRVIGDALGDVMKTFVGLRITV
jgi:hypothetical protein